MLHSEMHVPASDIDSYLRLPKGTARRTIREEWARRPEDSYKEEDATWDSSQT